jgi:hypothetical protein
MEPFGVSAASWSRRACYWTINAGALIGRSTSSLDALLGLHSCTAACEYVATNSGFAQGLAGQIKPSASRSMPKGRKFSSAVPPRTNGNDILGHSGHSRIYSKQDRCSSMRMMLSVNTEIVGHGGTRAVSGVVVVDSIRPAANQTNEYSIAF